MTDTIEHKKKPWIKYLLVLSLGLNLLIGGVIIGAMIGGPSHKGGQYSGGHGFKAFMNALPDDKRKEVRAHFKESRRKMRTNSEEIHRYVDEIQEIITTNPFEANALNTVLDNQRQRISSVTEDAQKAFVTIIADMSDEERAVFVERLKEQRLKHDKKRRKEKPSE